MSPGKWWIFDHHQHVFHHRLRFVVSEVELQFFILWFTYLCWNLWWNPLVSRQWEPSWMGKWRFVFLGGWPLEDVEDWWQKGRWVQWSIFERCHIFCIFHWFIFVGEWLCRVCLAWALSFKRFGTGDWTHEYFVTHAEVLNYSAVVETESCKKRWKTDSGQLQIIS